MLHAEVPGAHTLPRAEVCALKMALEAWGADRPLTVVTDATYTINGVDSSDREEAPEG